MKKVFYYAALDLTVVLVDGKEDFLSTLSANESMVLQNSLWSTISNFLTARALYMKDTVESLERIEQAGKHDTDIVGGG